ARRRRAAGLRLGKARRLALCAASATFEERHYSVKAHIRGRRQRAGSRRVAGDGRGMKKQATRFPAVLAIAVAGFAGLMIGAWFAFDARASGSKTAAVGPGGSGEADAVDPELARTELQGP